MTFTDEQIAGRMGLSTTQLSSSNIETINGFLMKYTEKVFNLNFLDSKWKTFAFRNKIKNMSTVHENLIDRFLAHLDDQCRKLHVSIMINEEIKEEANEFLPTDVKREVKSEQIEDRDLSFIQHNKKRKINNTGSDNLETEFLDEASFIDDSINETVYKTPETSRIVNGTFTASNSKTKLKFTEAFEKIEYDIDDETVKHDETIKSLSFKVKLNETESVNNFDIISPERHSFKIMRESTVKMAKTLDDELDLANKNNVNFSISDPTIQSQSSIFTKGRIVISNFNELDPVFEAKNLALETSQNVGIGKRVKINVSNLPKGTNLFLGQVLVCKGKNVTGEEFIIEEIILEKDFNSNESMSNGEATIVSVNGPFCNEKNMNYTIFDNFIKEKINNEIKPDYLILNGPLVDITNQCFSTGIIPPLEANGVFLPIETLDDIFLQIVYPILTKINTSTQVFIIPHASDSISKYSTYPQPSYLPRLLKLLKTEQIPENLHFTCNPSILNLSGLKFGVNNVDIFRNLKNISIENIFMNRFKTITKFMIQNNSFYPTYPTIPSLNDKKQSNKLSKELFHQEDIDNFDENFFADSLVTRNRMNKNISVNDVKENCIIPSDLNLDFIIHNSSYVPHLEQLDTGCVSINSNAFHQGGKLGFYSVITSKSTENNVGEVLATIKRV